MRALFSALCFLALWSVGAVSNAASVISPTGAMGETVSGAVTTFADGGASASFASRYMTAATSSGSPLMMVESYAAEVGSNSIAVTATRAIAAPEVAAAAVAVGAAWWVGHDAIGGPLANYLGLSDPNSPVSCIPGGAGYECADKTPPQTQDGRFWYTDASGGEAGTHYPTPGAACDALQASITADQHSGGNSAWSTFQPTCANPSGDGIAYVFQYGACNVVYGSQVCTQPDAHEVNIGSGTGSTSQCPASTDSENPSWSVPAGSPPGADGKCRSSLYQLASNAKAAADWANNASTDPTTQQNVVQSTLDAGGSIPVAADRTMAGPASVTGSTTQQTVTQPDGTIQDIGTTPTTSYTYSGPNITSAQSTTTTVKTTKPDGTTSTTTSTTGTTSTGAGGSGSTGTGTGTASGAGSDLCALHPDAVACDSLGTPDTSDPVWGQRTVTFAPEDIGMPSGCPAPRTFTVRGITFELNYQPACDVAPIVRAGLVAMTALGCALWIMSTVRA